VTVLVQQGALRRGDVVVAGEHMGKIRAMTDERGNEVKVAGPSTPVEIVGFGSVPLAGDRLEVVKDEKEARNVVARRQERNRTARLDEGGGSRVSLEELYRRMRQGEAKELNVVIKADVQGSAEAVRQALEELGNDEVRVRILQAGVGRSAKTTCCWPRPTRTRRPKTRS
jgi:translation initiation factor IF-2